VTAMRLEKTRESSGHNSLVHRGLLDVYFAADIRSALSGDQLCRAETLPVRYTFSASAIRSQYTSSMPI
jgi:hypothetical protein